MYNFNHSKTNHLDCVSQHKLNRDLEIASEWPALVPLNVNKQAVGSDTAAADLEELL